MSDEMKVAFVVNGAPAQVTVEPRKLLSDAIREDLGLTGTHVGCEQGVCGACTILMDGEAVRSCLLFAAQAEGSSITTIEGLTPHEGLSDVQEAIRDHHGLQCGFCTPGFVVSITALLNEPQTEASIRRGLSGNLCRCTGYQGLIRAVRYLAGIQEAQ